MDKFHSKWRPTKRFVKKKVSAARQKAVAARIERDKERKRLEQQLRPDSPQPSTSTASQPETESSVSTEKSTFAKKVNFFDEMKRPEETPEEYVVMSKSAIQELLKTKQTCKCRGSTPILRETESHGFEKKKLKSVCSVCDEPFREAYTSPRLKDDTSQRPPFEINRMLVEAFTSSGTGYSAMEKFGEETGIGIMSPFTWKQHLKAIQEESRLFKKSVLDQSRRAVRAAYGAENDDTIIDTVNTYDGTWHKRGHTSLYGIGIDSLTGLVVDFVIFSKYCLMCLIQEEKLGKDSDEFKQWLAAHKESNECQRNFSGSSGSMEVEAAVVMWKRSVSEWNCRYTTVLSDGDAKTFLTLCKEEVYGPEVQITKEECINHVSKRMVAGLEKIVQDNKVLKVTLGGRKEGSLKQQTITQLGTYYRKAIKDNIPDVHKMQKAVLATLYHCSSTDEMPQHEHCPEGEDSWCFYNKAEALGTEPKSHKEMSLKVNKLVFEKILPLYEKLSLETLMQRCTRGGTQNANESLHSVIWTYCPKETFVSMNRIDIGATRAVASFNMGHLKSITLRKVLASHPLFATAQVIATRKDAIHQGKSAKQAQTTSKRYKRKEQGKKDARKPKKAKQDDVLYKAGHF